MLALPHFKSLRHLLQRRVCGQGAHVINLSLRLTALAAKLLLILYMARYVSLADFGEYGLVSGTVAILITTLGIRLDYVVARELVSANAYQRAQKMRDQFVFYLLNYALLGTITLTVIITEVTGIQRITLVFIFLLSTLESCSAAIFTNLVSLECSYSANLMLLMRSGLWVFPVVALGLTSSAFRTSNTIFVAWTIGAAISIGYALWALRSLPWGALHGVPIDWKWVMRGTRTCILIWVSTVMTTAGTLVDRFVVAVDFNLEVVGVITFYGSFATALFSLVESSVFYVYPRLVSLYDNSEKRLFDFEAARLRQTAAVLGGLIALAMALIVPALGFITERSLLFEQAPTLWLLLFATWLRINAQALYFILFASHQDRAIWFGDLLYIVPSLGGNIVLVRLFGLIGVGYSAVISSTFILLWRAWHLRPNSQLWQRTDKLREPT